MFSFWLLKKKEILSLLVHETLKALVCNVCKIRYSLSLFSKFYISYKVLGFIKRGKPDWIWKLSVSRFVSKFFSTLEEKSWVIWYGKCLSFQMPGTSKVEGASHLRARHPPWDTSDWNTMQENYETLISLGKDSPLLIKTDECKTSIWDQWWRSRGISREGNLSGVSL